METKKCTKCGEVKSLDEFPNRKGSRDGKRNPCKQCTYKRQKVWQQANRDKMNKYAADYRRRNGYKERRVVKPRENDKECYTCGKVKPFSEFNKNKRKKDGLEYRCRDCENVYSTKKLRRKGIKPRKYTYRDDYGKSCSSCGIIKPWTDFSKERSRPDGHGVNCAPCRKNLANEYYHKKGKIKNKEYRLANKDKIRKQRKSRRDSDHLYRFILNIRGRISESIRNMGYTKRSKCTKILGCDWETLKQHFESQFTEGMSWENQGEWHIDHIIPISSAKTKDEVIKLNHYKNLQPLWASDNIRKYNSMPPFCVEYKVRQAIG